MNTTVITHFYNEEYLLPWWLQHHQKLFENGILIDYNSTDLSVEICRQLAPNWKVITSRNSMFGAADADSEVMDHEQTVEGFKMCLNITEFFMTYCSLEELDKEIESGVRTYGLPMADIEPENIPTYDKLLVEQKPFGIISGYEAFDDGIKNMVPDYFKIYGRYLHKDVNGNYSTGRHHSCNNYPNKFDLFTLKFKYSPWNENTIKRLQQFKDKIPSSDLVTETGSQHTRSEEEYIERYKNFAKTAVDLKTDENFLRCHNYITSL